MPGPGQKGGIKSPRGRGFLWGMKKGRKSKEKSSPQTTARKPGTPTGTGGGSGGYRGGGLPPWGGYSGGPVETEDQRSKRMEKEDANVRGYFHGGKVKGYGGGGKVKGKK